MFTLVQQTEPPAQHNTVSSAVYMEIIGSVRNLFVN